MAGLWSGVGMGEKTITLPVSPKVRSSSGRVWMYLAGHY